MMEKNPERIDAPRQPANSRGRIRIPLPRLHMNDTYDRVRSMYRPTHHRGVSEIDDNLALIYLHSIYSADMTMHLYIIRDILNILPSFEAQLPNSHCSSLSSSLLLPENSDTYVADPSRYNCVLGQGRIWWGSG